MTSTARKLVALALSGLALGACTARDAARVPSTGPRYASLDASLDGPPRPDSDIAPARAATPVAVLPAWIGRPVRLRERDEPDAFEQAVTLSRIPRGEGRDNVVLLHMRRAPQAGGSGGAHLAPGDRPSEAGIAAELAAAFPGTPMRVVTRPAANAYGPYGVAIGRTARGARCLYAWQWIEEAPDLDPALGRQPLSLRLRLCRDDVTLEAMAAAMNQLRLVPRFAGSVVTPAQASRGPPIAHRSHAGIRAVAAPPRDEAVHAAATATARTAVVRADETAAPMGRRYLGATEAPDDRRAPREAAPAPPPMNRAYGSAASTPVGPLTAGLPPEALRGPVARP